MGRDEPTHSTAAGNPNDTNGKPKPQPFPSSYNINTIIICDKCEGINTCYGKCIHDKIKITARSRSEGICFHREDSNPTLCDICNGTYAKNFRAKFGDFVEEMDYGTGNLPGSLPDFELA